MPRDLPAEPGADYSFASDRLSEHLLRGMVGFGSVALAWWLWPRFGFIAIAPAVLGVAALRGCPMCWTIGLVQTVSRNRYRRSCDDDGCVLVRAGSPPNA